MYRKIYRQEGGLAEEGYRAQISQAREKAIADWNRRTRGEVAERVRPRPRRAYRPANMPVDTERQQGLAGIQQVGKSFESLVRPPINLLQTYLGPDANIYDILNEPEMTPEMVTNIEDILKRQDGFEGTIRPEDFGFPKMTGPDIHTLPKTKEDWQSIVEAGPHAVANYFSLGNVPWTLDPTTGKYSFTGTEFDFPTKGTPFEGMGDFMTSGGLTGLLNRWRSRITGEEVDPETQRPYKVDIPDIYNPETKAALEYGDIEAQREAERRRLEQVDEYGGLADLPEAQADKAPYLFNPGDLADLQKAQPTGFEGTGYGGLPGAPETRSLNPLDYKNEFNFRRHYLSKYIDPSKDRFRDTGELEGYTFIPEIATQYRGDPHPEHDPEIYKQYIKAHQQANKIWAQRNQQPQQQPTGFEGTGYGGLADLPGQKVYYTNSTGSILYPGYLGLDYGDFYFHPDFEKKYTESPYKTTKAEWDKAWNKGVNQSVPTQPTGFEGTGYGQFSPQAAGGVYRPTGNIGLRPAGTTPTNINTRPYQPLAAY